MKFPFLGLKFSTLKGRDSIILVPLFLPAFLLAEGFKSVILSRLTVSDEIYLKSFEELITETNITAICQRAICAFVKDHRIIRELDKQGRLEITHQELHSSSESVEQMLSGEKVLIDRDDRVLKYAEIYEAMGAKALNQREESSLVAFPISRRIDSFVRGKFEFLVVTMLESGLWRHYESIYGLPRFDWKAVSSLHHHPFGGDEIRCAPLELDQLALPFYSLISAYLVAPFVNLCMWSIQKEQLTKPENFEIGQEIRSF